MKYFETQWMRPNKEIGTLDQEEREHLDEAVQAYRKGEVVKIQESFHRRQWQYFVEQTADTQGQCLIANRLPDTWPTNKAMQITVAHDVIDTRSRMMWQRRDDMKLKYNRQVEDFEHEFVMPYGTWQWQRQQVFEHIEQSGVLEHSRYSRPGHTMEGSKELTEQQRYDHRHNIKNLWPIALKCHCWVVLDSWCLDDDLLAPVTEKVLYPVFYGIPFIYIGGATQRSQLQELGIRPNDSMRTTARSVTEQMLYLQTIFRDSKRSQEWQAQQGETIQHNITRITKFATEGVGW